jgi:hypothetical protein
MSPLSRLARRGLGAGLAEAQAVLGQLRRLASRWRVVIAGAGATPETAARAGVEYVSDDPTTAAERLSVTRASTH